MTRVIILSAACVALALAITWLLSESWDPCEGAEYSGGCDPRRAM